MLESWAKFGNDICLRMNTGGIGLKRKICHLSRNLQRQQSCSLVDGKGGDQEFDLKEGATWALNCVGRASCLRPIAPSPSSALVPVVTTPLLRGGCASVWPCGAPSTAAPVPMPSKPGPTDSLQALALFWGLMFQSKP